MSLWDSHRCPVGHLTIASGYSFAGCQPPSPTHHTQHLHFQHPRGPSPPSSTPGREQVLPPLCRPHRPISTACLPAFPTRACMLPPFSPTCAWERLPTHLLQTTFSTTVLESIGSPATSWGLAPLASLGLPTSPVAGAAAWLSALGDVHPWEGAIFHSLELSRTQQHPRDSACTRSAWSKTDPISSCTPYARCGPGVQDTEGSKAFYYYSCHQKTSAPGEKQACAC